MPAHFCHLIISAVSSVAGFKFGFKLGFKFGFKIELKFGFELDLNWEVSLKCYLKNMIRFPLIKYLVVISGGYFLLYPITILKCRLCGILECYSCQK